MAKQYDSRQWKKWRQSGAMPKTSIGVSHCIGENGAACGHVGEDTLSQADFAKKSEKECCPACWKFASVLGLLSKKVVQTERYEPLRIPRILHARETPKKRFRMFRDYDY